MTNKKCPKCGSQEFSFTIEGRATLFYIVENGRVIANGGEGVDDVMSITCSCHICNHVWHPRKFQYEIDE